MAKQGFAGKDGTGKGPEERRCGSQSPKPLGRWGGAAGEPMARVGGEVQDFTRLGREIYYITRMIMASDPSMRIKSKEAEHRILEAAKEVARLWRSRGENEKADALVKTYGLDAASELKRTKRLAIVVLATHSASEPTSRKQMEAYVSNGLFPKGINFAGILEAAAGMQQYPEAGQAVVEKHGLSAEEAEIAAIIAVFRKKAPEYCGQTAPEFISSLRAVMLKHAPQLLEDRMVLEHINNNLRYRLGDSMQEVDELKA